MASFRSSPGSEEILGNSDVTDLNPQGIMSHMKRSQRYSARISSAFGFALLSFFHESAIVADQPCSLTDSRRTAAVPEFLLASCQPVSLQACTDDTCTDDSCTEDCGEIVSTPSCCESLMARPTLGADWFGSRSHLAESGFNFSVSTTQYFQGVLDGGLNNTSQYGGRNDIFMNVQGEKAGLWKGFFITMHAESRYGDSVIQDTGSLLPANLALALPQPSGTVTALTGVKFSQFLSEDFLVFAGKINTFDDFQQPLTGAGGTNGFMNTALMINPVVVRTVPYSTFGAGFAMLQNLEPVFSMAVFDTNDNPTNSGFDTFFDDGVSMLSSLNLPTDWMNLPGHQGLFGTYSTGTYTNLSPSVYFQPGEGVVVDSPPKEGSWSIGYSFDQAFYVAPDDPKKRWGAFAMLGIADDNPSPVRWFANAGLAGTSPIAGRSADTFGAGYYYTGVSGALKDLAPVLLPLGDEQGFELYYNLAVTPWFHITPDVQFVDPFRERVDESVMIGVRGKIDF
jgi:porin